MQFGKVLGTLVVARALVACGGLVPSDLFTPSDGGAVATTDGASLVKDAQTSSTDDARETSVGPTIDAPNPPPFNDDAATDLPDAGDDAGTPPTSTVIPCGASSCSGGTPVCCVTVEMQGGQQQGSSSCVASSSDCTAAGSVTVECASTSDCPSGDSCCLEFNGMTHAVDGVACKSSCGMSGLVVCEPNGPSGQCPSGQTCMMSQFPGYGVCFGGH